MKMKSRSQEILTKEFEIKEFEKLKYFLEIAMDYSKSGIFISHQKCHRSIKRKPVN